MFLHFFLPSFPPSSLHLFLRDDSPFLSGRAQSAKGHAQRPRRESDGRTRPFPHFVWLRLRERRREGGPLTAVASSQSEGTDSSRQIIDRQEGSDDIGNVGRRSPGFCPRGSENRLNFSADRVHRTYRCSSTRSPCMFCNVSLCELKGPTWAESSYSIIPPAHTSSWKRKISQRNNSVVCLPCLLVTLVSHNLQFPPFQNPLLIGSVVG